MFSGLSGAIILLNASRSLLEVAGTWGNCEFSGAVFEPDSCWALRIGHSYEVEASGHRIACAHAETVKGSYFCIPIQAHGETLGVIHFQKVNETESLSQAELELAAAFAEQAALSIANIRLREALCSQSIRDALTGLFNRRYLEETLERELHRASRNHHSLGVIMLDLDHLGAIVSSSQSQTTKLLTQTHFKDHRGISRMWCSFLLGPGFASSNPHTQLLIEHITP